MPRTAFLALSIIVLSFAIPRPARASLFEGTLYFTSYYNSSASNNPSGVHSRSVSYDGAGSLTLGKTVDLVTFAPRVGADGIVFTGDGFLAVGGEGNLVHKVDPIRINTFTNVAAGNTGAFHMMVAPDGTIYSSGIPGTPASYRSDLSGGGTAHPLSGDDRSIDTIAWSDPHHAFYTSSGAGGVGDFGVIDLNTFHTTRIFSNLPAAHGMVFDPYTGDLVLFGAKHITQIDPVTHSIVSDLNLSGNQYPFGSDAFDQGTTDGLGHFFVANNSGYLAFLDITKSRRVGNPDFLRTPFLGSQLDDIAPLIGPGSVPEPGSAMLLASGALVLFGFRHFRRPEVVSNSSQSGDPRGRSA